MNENDILVFAAKADGWTGWQSKHGYWNLTDGDGNKFVVCENWENPTFRDALLAAGYSPENDDGQALRLAVKLNSDLTIGTCIKVVLSVPTPDGEDTYFAKIVVDPEASGLTKEEATRLAIVRAAAAIGESMP